MRAFLQTISDNKSVEDVHHEIKVQIKKKPNNEQTLDAVQNMAIDTNAFDRRGVRHPSKVTKDIFVEGYRSAKHKRKHNCHRPYKHKLPSSWMQLCGRKTWPSTNEVIARRGAAAWHWLQTLEPGDAIDGALHSSLLGEFKLFRRIGGTPGADVFFSFL